jgi:hypothetical protein
LLEHRPQPGQSFTLGTGVRPVIETVEDIVTFEISGGGNVIFCGKKAGGVAWSIGCDVGRSESTLELLEGPDVELALLAFGIGVQ